MAKQVQGSCNRCGHCGCYVGAGGNAKWYPGIGGGMRMQYYESNPSIQPILFQLIKDEFADQYGRPWEITDVEFALPGFRISGGGSPIVVDIYVSPKGIHISATDFSCPWLESTLNATITGTTFTTTTVLGSSTSGSVVNNLVIASGGSVGIVNNVAPNTLTVYSWVGGIPIDGEEIEVRANVCLLWGRTQLPPNCNSYPQAFQYAPNGEALIAAWEINHPHTGSGGLCGYYWIDV
jgi:hypothetical protein